MYKGHIMTKIYILYITIPNKIFDLRLKYLIDSVDSYEYKIKENSVTALYAWSKSYKMIKEFLKARCENVFTLKEKEFDDDEYDAFRDKNRESKLGVYQVASIPTDSYEALAGVEFVDKEHFVDMVLTNYEHKNISLYKSENMNEFGPKAFNNMDYTIFTDEIIQALKVLGYVTLYDSSFIRYEKMSDEYLERYENAMNVLEQVDVESDLVTPLMMTEYIVLVFLYSYTFIGM